jgi:23S rRNA (uracil1939-C5)-methyltransferase
MRIVDLSIEDVAFGGKGVARESGKAVFVPFTIEGEKVSAQIVREKKQFAEAELLDLKEASPHRVEAPCPYFGRCGGCAYQHIDYEHQLAIKFRQVGDVLRRIAKLKNVPMRPIIPSPFDYNYRNRITVHAQEGVIGFYQRDSHRLIDIEHCPIAMDEVNRALAKLRGQRVRDGHYTLRAESDSLVFSQTNDAVAKALRDLVAQFVPAGQQLLVDAYCGAGFFAKALLDRFERVIGIDWDRFAIEAAKKNATAKETYIAGDIENELAGVAAPLSRGDVEAVRDRRSLVTLIVDPPATGLTANIRRTIVDLAPSTLIYVSCNPATLARDLAELQQEFRIESVTPLDMFPQTAEIEVAVHLRAQ